MLAPLWRIRLAFTLLFPSLLAAMGLWGGWAVIAWVERAALHEATPVGQVMLATLATALAALAAVYLWRQVGRRLLFALALAAMVMLVSLLAGELAVRMIAPPWPAIGLHGVQPWEGARGWAHVIEKPGAQGLNDWGQRDRPRSIQPASDVHRIIFLGDSFLEESSITPVSLLTEDLLSTARVSGQRIEIVNLGVSASDPDEYFYRTKNIALPLRPRHVFVFVCMSNDFNRPITLASWGGAAAVYPRDSLLSVLRLRGINHALTNWDRPLISAWAQAGGLLASERKIFEQVQSASSIEIARSVVQSAPEDQRDMLRMRLASQDLTPLIDMIRNPDGGSFRTYYFKPAAIQASSYQSATASVDPQPGFAWLMSTVDLLKRHGVETTLVLIPEGSTVDPRMRACWLPLGDLAAFHAPLREIAGDIVEECAARNINVIDLHPKLDGKPGMYLNMDGHWSDAGNRVVADVLADAIRERYHLPQVSATAPSTNTAAPAPAPLP